MKRAMFIAGWVVLAAGPVQADLVGALDPVTPRNDLQHLNPGGGGTACGDGSPNASRRGCSLQCGGIGGAF